MSKKTAPGICSTANSFAGARLSSGMYQEASTTRTSFRCEASHCVVTSGFISRTYAS